MQGPANRSVVIVSGLLTLLVLCGATLALALHNGWLRVAADAPTSEAVTARAQPTAGGSGPVAPPARVAESSTALTQDAAQDQVAVYRAKFEESYRALDDAYTQIRSLQSPEPRFALRGDGDESSSRRHHDDGPPERQSRRRDSDDD